MNFLLNPLFLLFIFLILIGGEFALFGFFFTTFKSVSRVFKSIKGKDLMKVLAENLEHVDEVDKYLAQLSKEIKQDRRLLQLTIHKIGIIRFNPFKDMGGKQSFCVAFLNTEDSGVILTSFYSKDGMRTYVKQVIKGTSEQNLSLEEQKAIQEAQKNFNK